MVLGSAGASPGSSGWDHLNPRHPDFHCRRCRNLSQSRGGKKKVCFLQPGVRPPLGGTPGRGVIRYSSSLYIDAGRPPPRYLPFSGELTCQITKASELKSQRRCPPPQTPGGCADIALVAADAGIRQYDTCLDFPTFLFITHLTPALIRATI